MPPLPQSCLWHSRIQGVSKNRGFAFFTPDGPGPAQAGPASAPDGVPGRGHMVFCTASPRFHIPANSPARQGDAIAAFRHAPASSRVPKKPGEHNWPGHRPTMLPHIPAAWSPVGFCPSGLPNSLSHKAFSPPERHAFIHGHTDSGVTPKNSAASFRLILCSTTARTARLRIAPVAKRESLQVSSFAMPGQ